MRNDAEEVQEATDLEGEGTKVEGREGGRRRKSGETDYRGDVGV